MARNWNEVKKAKEDADRQSRELAQEMKVCCFHKDAGPGQHRGLRRI